MWVRRLPAGGRATHDAAVTAQAQDEKTTILRRPMRQQSAASQGMTVPLTAVAHFMVALDALVIAAATCC